MSTAPKRTRRPVFKVDAEGTIALVTDRWTGTSYWVEWDESAKRWTCSACGPHKRGEACSHICAYARSLPLAAARRISRGLSKGAGAYAPRSNPQAQATNVEPAVQPEAEESERKAAVLAAKAAEKADEDRLRAERATSWTRTEDDAAQPRKKRVVTGPFGAIDTRAEDVSWLARRS